MTVDAVATPRPETGRRKEAVARVRLLAGSGQHLINDRRSSTSSGRLWCRRPSRR